MSGGSILGRRGMSPLIATVLLMAFAVALGGMIMNWSIDSGGASSACNGIVLHVDQFCARDDRVVLNIRNDGNSPTLAGIKLNVLEASIESTYNIKNSELNPGQRLEIEVPAPVSLKSKGEILAVIGTTNPVTCTDAKASADPIPQC